MHDHDHHGHHADHCHDHGPKAPRGPKRPGILLSAFGTSVIEARQAYDRFEARVRERYPDLPLAWGFTAHKVRRKLAAQGLPHDCVAVALSRMHDSGVTHLVVQSLHTIPGVEFDWTKNLAAAYEHPRKGFQQVVMGAPLLNDQEDFKRICACLPGYIPAQRQPDEAVILAGHGTYHAGQKHYLALQDMMTQRDPLLFMGLLMGRPDIEAMIAKLQQAGVRTVWLSPFMAVCGHHVCRDMFGEQSGSWRKQLLAAGFTVREQRVGTIEFPCFQEIWLDHLAAAMGELRLAGA